MKTSGYFNRVFDHLRLWVISLNSIPQVVQDPLPKVLQTSKHRLLFHHTHPLAGIPIIDLQSTGSDLAFEILDLLFSFVRVRYEFSLDVFWNLSVDRRISEVKEGLSNSFVNIAQGSMMYLQLGNGTTRGVVSHPVILR